MEKEEAIQALKDIKEILDENNVKFWLESGTLLGAIREGGFISWDYDIDLGTWDKYMIKMKKITKTLSKIGYETYYSQFHNIMMIRKKEVDIQLVFWRLDNGEAIAPLRYIENKVGILIAGIIWLLLFSRSGKINRETVNSFPKIIKLFGTKLTDYLPQSLKIKIVEILNKIAVKTGNRRGLVVTPSKYFLNLKKVKFYDMEFLVPENAEDYLVYYYGEDWQTPKKEWNYVREDKKIISKTEKISRKWEYRKFFEKFEK
ncbi:MAG: LicD family protein [Candidatus Heimdallarchaeaceae archaeon]